MDLRTLKQTSSAKLPCQTSIYLKDTITAWKMLRKLIDLLFVALKYMPLENHPEFPQRTEVRTSETWRNKGIMVVKYTMHIGKKTPGVKSWWIISF